MFGISDNFVDQCLIRFDKDDQIDILIETLTEFGDGCHDYMSKWKRGGHR